MIIRKFIFFALTVAICLSVKAQNNLIDFEYKEKNDSIELVFTNISSDTIYLFSTYFDEPYVSSSFLHRIDKEKGEYKVSFLPILPYMSAYLTDRVILSDNDKILMKGQNKYQFIEILPKEKTILRFSYNVLFAKKNEKKNVVKDFQVETVHSKSIKKLTANKLKGEYDLLFEFAYYSDVQLLLERELYITSGMDAYKQERKYQVIKQKMNLNIPDFPVKLNK